MAKEFKTIGELVLLLESRGVKTDEDTPVILKRESYYAIVNGYKDPFLDREAMQASPSDVYKAGTTFGQLYDLYCFDRDMRGALLPYLMEAEMCKNEDNRAGDTSQRCGNSPAVYVSGRFVPILGHAR